MRTPSCLLRCFKTLAFILWLLYGVVYPGLRWLFNYCVWFAGSAGSCVPAWSENWFLFQIGRMWRCYDLIRTQRPPLLTRSGLSLHIDVVQCKLLLKYCQWLDKVIATESATQRSCASPGGNKKEPICARLWAFVVYNTLSAPERLFPVRKIPHQPYLLMGGLYWVILSDLL